MTVPLAHRVDGPASAPVVVLGPSLGATWEMWDDLTAGLVPTYQVVRYDTPGHGRSPVPPQRYGVADLARDVLDLLTSLGVDRFAFVGLSLGGAVGQTLGSAYADRLTSLVLCCTAPVFGSPGGWHERAAVVRSAGLGAITEATKGRWFTDAFRAGHPDEVDRLIAMLSRVDPEGYARCCEALAGFSWTERLAEIGVPTRVVAGAHDPVCPLDQCRAMAEAIPGDDLVVLDASHLASAERPAELHAAVIDHLRRGQ
jgi:3-oxoadipate enol-lactonase